jgi:FkbM family methyltransferase
MERPCRHASPQADCYVCRLFESDPRYRALTGAPAVAPVEPTTDATAWSYEHERHRELFADYVGRALAAPPLAGDGRGLVVPAGGPVYFTAAYVLIACLRRLGCALPVELWHLAPEELDDVMAGLLDGLGGVTRVCARDVGGAAAPRSGWGLKPFALLHSRFAEALLLDADQVPARDPTDLFTAGPYQDRGAVLWPDLRNGPGLDVTADAFRVFGLPVPGRTRRPGHDKPTDYRPVESGQLLVDRRRAGAEVRLACLLAGHEDFLYPAPAGRRRWLCYGDKSVFLAAWCMAAQARGAAWDYGKRTPFAMPRDCRFVGDDAAGAFLQHDFAGQVVFSHRVQPFGIKWRLHGPNERRGLPGEEAAFAALAELAGRWHGRVWDPADMTEDDRACAELLAGRRWLCRRPDRPLTELAFEPGGVVRAAAGDRDLVRWRVAHWDGRPTVVLGRDRAAAVALGQDAYGNWVNHGAGAVLVPALPEGWRARETFDGAVYQAVARANEYGLPEAFGPADRVLDVGGHVGAFAHACLLRGAGRVWSVEPAAANQEALRRHLAAFARQARWALVPAALWAGPPRTVLVGPAGDAGLAGRAVLPDAGAGADGAEAALALDLDTLVLLATDQGAARLRLLKLDCEGAEWPALAAATRLDLVDEVVGEAHPNHLAGGRDRRWLEALFAAAGFAFTWRGHPAAAGLGNFWARRPARAGG